MKHPLKTIVPLLAVAALATACNPFTHGNSRSNGLQDPRFAPFTYTSDRKAKVQTRLDSFNERWPGMQATDGNVVAARTHSGFLHALDQDPEYWLTGVATVHRPHHDNRHPHGRGDRGRERSARNRSTAPQVRARELPFLNDQPRSRQRRPPTRERQGESRFQNPAHQRYSGVQGLPAARPHSDRPPLILRALSFLLHCAPASSIFEAGATSCAHTTIAKLKNENSP